MRVVFRSAGNLMPLSSKVINSGEISGIWKLSSDLELGGMSDPMDDPRQRPRLPRPFRRGVQGLRQQ